MKVSSVEVIGPAILIRIAKSYHEGMGGNELYEATRGVWRVGSHREAVRHALAVAGGIVREVYEVQSWQPAGSNHYKTRKAVDVKIEGRWEFSGKVADQEVRSRYLNKSVAHYFKSGSANPITYVEGKEKIARVCWNTNFWRSPSGPEGKSYDKNSYEKDTGYGHEEWNFDTEKTIDGYVYGFLQQFNTITDKYREKSYNLSLYAIESINTYSNKKWWLGRINDAEVLSTAESVRAHKVYMEQGWLSEMVNDLNRLGVKSKPLKETSKETFFNIRFKVSNLELLDEPIEFKITNEVIPSFYYNLLEKKGDPVFEEKGSIDFKFKAGHCAGKTQTTVTTRGSKTDKSLLHNEIQTEIYDLMVSRFGEGNVGTENVIGYQTKIDLVTRDESGSYTFYEIKTLQTAKGAIREALGQIFEYAYWPDSKHADKLVIISPQRVTTQVRSYVTKLRCEFNIPIYYQHYNCENKSLSELY